MNQYEDRVKTNIEYRRDQLIYELESYFRTLNIKMDKYEPFMMGLDVEDEFTESQNAQLCEFADNLIKEINYLAEELDDVKSELRFFKDYLTRDDAIFRYKRNQNPVITTWSDSAGCYAQMETDEYFYIVNSECSECLSMFHNNEEEPYMPEDMVFSLEREKLSDKGKEIYDTLHDRLLKEFGNSYRNL